MTGIAKRRATSGMLGRLEIWLRERREHRLMKRFGGIQWCPWCRQCAQSGSGVWGFKPWDVDYSLDVLTCSVCAGTSVWLWGLGMIYMRELDPPEPAFDRRLHGADLAASFDERSAA